MHNQAPVSVVGKGQLGEAPGGLVIGGAITPGQGGARLLRAMILTWFDLDVRKATQIVNIEVSRDPPPTEIFVPQGW